MTAPTIATQPLTDHELIRESHTQPEAFGVIFDRHFSLVLGYLTRRVGGDRGGELASETFTRAFARRHRYEAQTGDARAWLLGIATNLVRGDRRSEARRLRAYARAPFGEAHEMDTAADARMDAAAQARAAAVAIGRLPRKQRDVLLLHAWADLTSDEIAAATGAKPGTVRSDLSRARARVAADLAQQPAVPSTPVIDGESA
jgi:RNA polymerase sigma factor (sigma-70 family)